MTLKVPRALMEAVEKTAESAFPEECCGLLIGPIPNDFAAKNRRVAPDEARPLPNGWESGARERRYAVDPKAILKVEKELSGTGRGIVGVYHSHPDCPAWPSPFDLERAWPCLSYWIVSVRQGRAEGSRSWVRDESGESFHEEQIEVQ